MAEKYMLRVRETHLVDYCVMAESKQDAASIILNKRIEKITSKFASPLNLVIESVQSEQEIHLQDFDDLKLPPIRN